MSRKDPRSALTPGEKREKAKKKVREELTNLRAKAAKLGKQVQRVEEVLNDTGPQTKGRVLEEPDLLPPKAAQEIQTEQTVLFKPNAGPQTEFLSAPETDVLYGGQAGGGKSYSLIVDPLRFAHRSAHRALLLRKTLNELGELIDNTRDLYPKAFPGARYLETKKTWIFPSGAKLLFGFLEKESDVYQYQGRAFSWIGFDELTHLPTEFAWNYLASRLRTTDDQIQCYLRATTNPGGPGHAWVKKRYVDPAPANQAFQYGKNPMTGASLTRKFIPASLSDNPYLYDRGDYQAMLETLPEVERRRLLHGDWDVNEGAAFPEFSRAIHVQEPFEIPAGWNRIKAIDYGYTAPSACVWGAVHPDTGQVFIYRELYQKGLTGEELAKRISEMERPETRTIVGVLDGAAWNRTGYTGPTIGQQLCTGPYGHKLRPADKNRTAGKVQIHQYLKQNDKGAPQLVIFNTCKNLIQELSSLPLSKTNSEDVDTHCDDHAYDALRYLLMSRPRKETVYDTGFTFKKQAQLANEASQQNTFHPYIQA